MKTLRLLLLPGFLLLPFLLFPQKYTIKGTLGNTTRLEGAETMFDLGKMNIEMRSSVLGEVAIKGEADPDLERYAIEISC